MLHKAVIQHAYVIAQAIWDIKRLFFEELKRSYWIKEVLIFGSTAYNNPEPTDLDIMLIVSDEWYNSMINSKNKIFPYGHGYNTELLFCDLTNDTHFLFVEGGISLKETRDTTDKLFDLWFTIAPPVHVFFLPESFFSDINVQKAISKKQPDVLFFDNCFSRTLRWDSEQKDFVVTEGSDYYKAKYHIPTCFF